MKKVLRVVVVFEFNEVSDPDSLAADRIVDALTDATEEYRIEHGATDVFVDEVEAVEDVA
jgi:hypothetical protein